MSKVFYIGSKGMIELNNCIKQIRQKKGLSQQELANLCDVSRQTINAIENNKYDPTLKLAFNIAKYLNASVDTLFYPDGKDESS
jgi:putative transcriptional regulator